MKCRPGQTRGPVKQQPWGNPLLLIEHPNRLNHSFILLFVPTPFPYFPLFGFNFASWPFRPQKGLFAQRKGQARTMCWLLAGLNLLVGPGLSTTLWLKAGMNRETRREKKRRRQKRAPSPQSAASACLPSHSSPSRIASLGNRHMLTPPPPKGGYCTRPSE